MDARDELRLRVAAADCLVQASDATNPLERDRWLSSAKAMIDAANGRARSMAERGSEARYLAPHLEQAAPVE